MKKRTKLVQGQKKDNLGRNGNTAFMPKMNQTHQIGSDSHFFHMPDRKRILYSILKSSKFLQNRRTGNKIMLFLKNLTFIFNRLVPTFVF